MADQNTGDEGQVKRRKTRAQLEQERDRAELHAMLKEPTVRAFVWRLLKECQISSFGFSGEALIRAEGARKVGAWVIEEVDAADPRAYSIMRDEMTSREANLKKDMDDG